MTQNQSQNKVCRSEFIFLIYFVIMLFARAAGLDEGMFIYKVTLVTGMFFFGLKILMTENSVFEIISMAAIICLGLLVYHNTGEKGFLIYITMMFGMKAVSIQRVFRTGMTVWALTFVSLLFLSLTGIISENVFMHDKSGIGYILCHSLGYPHSNVLHIAYLVLASFVVYCIRNMTRQNKSYVTVLLMLGNLYVFLYSVSYTGLISTTLFCVFFLIMSSSDRIISRAGRVMLQMVFPVCVIFSVAGPVLIKGRLFELINKVLNTRFSLSLYFLTQQPITLFGSRLETPNYRYTMDCSYVYALVQLGVIPFALICLMYIFVIHDYVINNKKTELVIILGMCIAGVAEPFMFNMAYKNLAFLFFGEFLFRKMKSISSELPSLLNRPIWIIRSGDNEVNRKFLVFDNLYLCIVSSLEKIRKHTKFCLGIIVMAGVLSCAASIIVIPETNSIYVDSNINENDDLNSVSFTEDEVRVRKSKGDLFFGYSGESDKMYAYSGFTASIEHTRLIISIGIFACIFTMLILMVFYYF